MSKTIKALMVVGIAAVAVAACAKKEAPAPAPEAAPMVQAQPSSGKM